MKNVKIIQICIFIEMNVLKCTENIYFSMKIQRFYFIKKINTMHLI